MGINLAILRLKKSIVNSVNDSKLPPAVIAMILSEFTKEMENLSKQAIDRELKAEEEGEEDGEEIHKD